MRLVDADVADKWMRQNNAFIDAAILKAIPTIDAVPVGDDGAAPPEPKGS